MFTAPPKKVTPRKEAIAQALEAIRKNILLLSICYAEFMRRATIGRVIAAESKRPDAVREFEQISRFQLIKLSERVDRLIKQAKAELVDFSGLVNSYEVLYQDYQKNLKVFNDISKALLTPLIRIADQSLSGELGAFWDQTQFMPQVALRLMDAKTKADPNDLIKMILAQLGKFSIDDKELEDRITFINLKKSKIKSKLEKLSDEDKTATKVDDDFKKLQIDIVLLQYDQYGDALGKEKHQRSITAKQDEVKRLTTKVEENANSAQKRAKLKARDDLYNMYIKVLRDIGGIANSLTGFSSSSEASHPADVLLNLFQECVIPAHSLLSDEDMKLYQPSGAAVKPLFNWQFMMYEFTRRSGIFNNPNFYLELLEDFAKTLTSNGKDGLFAQLYQESLQESKSNQEAPQAFCELVKVAVLEAIKKCRTKDSLIDVVGKTMLLNTHTVKLGFSLFNERHTRFNLYREAMAEEKSDGGVSARIIEHLVAVVEDSSRPKVAVVTMKVPSAPPGQAAHAGVIKPTVKRSAPPPRGTAGVDANASARAVAGVDAPAEMSDAKRRTAVPPITKGLPPVIVRSTPTPAAGASANAGAGAAAAGAASASAAGMSEAKRRTAVLPVIKGLPTIGGAAPKSPTAGAAAAGASARVRPPAGALGAGEFSNLDDITEGGSETVLPAINKPKMVRSAPPPNAGAGASSANADAIAAAGAAAGAEAAGSDAKRGTALPALGGKYLSLPQSAAGELTTSTPRTSRGISALLHRASRLPQGRTVQSEVKHLDPKLTKIAETIGTMIQRSLGLEHQVGVKIDPTTKSMHFFMNMPEPRPGVRGMPLRKTVPLSFGIRYLQLHGVKIDDIQELLARSVTYYGKELARELRCERVEIFFSKSPKGWYARLHHESPKKPEEIAFTSLNDRFNKKVFFVAALENLEARLDSIMGERATPESERDAKAGAVAAAAAAAAAPAPSGTAGARPVVGGAITPAAGARATVTDAKAGGAASGAIGPMRNVLAPVTDAKAGARAASGAAGGAPGPAPAAGAPAAGSGVAGAGAAGANAGAGAVGATPATATPTAPGAQNPDDEDDFAAPPNKLKP